MKSYKQQILEYLEGEGGFIATWNCEGARYYGASFYGRSAWEGEFIWEHELDDKRKNYKYIVDLTTMEFIEE